MMVYWLFFNFVALFIFGCCSLAQEISFVDHYLPYFRQSISPALCQHFCLSNLCLLKVPMEIRSLPLPLLRWAYSTLAPLLHFPFQFLIYCSGFFFFLQGEGSVCPGSYAGLSQGWLWEYCVMLGAHLLVCRCLPCRFGAGVWWCSSSPVFSVLHDLEKLCTGWGFRVSKFWFFLVLYFCQVWLHHLRKIFDLRSSHCLLLHSSLHLGSLV
jgi:hypothetical protein